MLNGANYYSLRLNIPDTIMTIFITASLNFLNPSSLIYKTTVKDLILVYKWQPNLEH